jgi:DNA-binding FadR family transcriptional regulator
MEARLVIEPSIAALAARRASAEDIDHLQELVRDSHNRVEQPEEFRDVDIHIHGAIVQMTRNPVLINVADAIGRVARAQREFTNPDPTMRQEASTDHERLLQALAVHDSERAFAAMREHLEHVRSRLLLYQEAAILQQAPRRQAMR